MESIIKGLHRVFLLLKSYTFVCQSGKARRTENLLLVELESTMTYETTYTKARKNEIHESMRGEVQLFTFDSIAASTNDFSTANKLGEGGFGLVYKVSFRSCCL